MNFEMTQDAFNIEIEKFKEFLNSNHYRKTPERFEILKCALDCEGHFDVDILYNLLEEKGYHVSRATVYSTLELLCEAGMVRRLLFDTHQARYEIAGKNHCHLVCTDCGEIREIELEDIYKKLDETDFCGFSPSNVSICIYGKCDKCRYTDKEADRSGKPL